MMIIIMKRTQIQLPEPLYEEIKRVARTQEWSITEVLRRGAEHIVRVYPADGRGDVAWSLPEASDLGTFLAPVDEWRELASERGDDR